MAKKAPAKKLPAKRKPRPKKPVVPADGSIEFSEFSPETLERLKEILDRKEAKSDAVFLERSEKVFSALKHLIPCVLSLVIGAAAGVYAAGGIAIGPDGGGKNDAVSEVFDTMEAAFRRLSPERAKLIRDGTLTSEKASADWMAEKYLPESDAAWAKLLTAEAEAFGGEKWTAEKEAAHIEGYAR